MSLADLFFNANSPERVSIAESVKLKHNNMTTEKKPRATRTPRNAETITKGALELEFNEKVALIKTLKENVAAEIKSRNEAAAMATEAAKDL